MIASVVPMPAIGVAHHAASPVNTTLPFDHRVIRTCRNTSK